ncbi:MULTISPECIES: hypothetical protein [unclassified Streptomyces]
MNSPRARIAPVLAVLGAGVAIGVAVHHLVKGLEYGRARGQRAPVPSR